MTINLTTRKNANNRDNWFVNTKHGRELAEDY